MMKIKHLILLTFTLLSPYISYAQVKQAGIQPFLSHRGLKHASIGICIKDMSGKQLTGHNQDKAYTPASILKVVTTATALELLGPNYKYKTTLASDKTRPQHLLIHGYGDPTLGSEHLNKTQDAFLKEWTAQIEQQFDNTMNLDMTLIDDYFGYEGISERWIYQDMGNYYAAASYGISIYDNTYKLFFNTTRSDTCPVIIGTQPSVGLTFHNNLRLNTTGRDNAYIQGVPLSRERILSGDIPAGKTSFSIKGDIPIPSRILGEELTKHLAIGGTELGGGIMENSYKKYEDQMYSKTKEGFNEEVFYTHYSPPLKDIIKVTNVKSNNHYAEHLIRTVGRERNPDIYSPALEEGIKMVNEFWTSKGINTDALTMFDGSGLAPSNAVSAEFMCNLLVYMQTKSKYADDFLRTLPEAGKEGTVRNRLKGTRLAGKIRMKSGSIYGVQCFSGYYIDGDKKYAFTIMVNKFNGSRSQITQAIDNLLLATF